MKVRAICGQAIVWAMLLGVLGCAGTPAGDAQEQESTATEAVCGDGLVSNDEPCDDGGMSSSCDDDCTLAECGDGLVNEAAGESCDDGNTDTESCEYGVASCTVCSHNCLWGNGIPAYCGNGSIEAQEQCDDGGESETCDDDCTEASCGDGVLNGLAGEVCDDGNTVTEVCDYGLTSCEVCNFLCQPQPGTAKFCGDGNVDYTYGESCDEQGETALCDSDCTSVSCGDGMYNPTAGEACDEGAEPTQECEYGLESCEVCTTECGLVAGTPSFCGDAWVDPLNEFCELGETRTQGCADYDPTRFESGTVSCASSCMADTSLCIELPYDAQYEECTGAGLSPFVQGSCEDELYCLPFITEDTGNCMRPCEGPTDTVSCGDDVCVELTAGYFCFQQSAERDDVCQENFNLCMEDAGDCVPHTYDAGIQQGVDLRCTVTCDGADIGSQGSCADGERCYRNTVGWVDLARDAANQMISCDTVSDCATGFECLDVGTGRYCAKFQGWCGETVPICGDLDDYDWYNCAFEPEMQCSLSEGHSYCGVVDDVENPAFAMCLDVGLSTGLCIATCEDEEGQELECGEGYYCDYPNDDTQLTVFYRLQEPSVSCTDDTACAADHVCRYFGTQGYQCATLRKHCMAIPDPAPIITAVTPSSGSTSGGTSVTITGENFQAGGWVRFGPSYGYSLTFVSPTELTVTSPYSSQAGHVTIIVQNPDGQVAELAMGFEYISPPPMLTNINPSNGPVTGGTVIVLSGSGFQAGSQVFFGGQPAASVTYASMYSMSCVSPVAESAGEVGLKVINPDGQVSSLPFVYDEVIVDPDPGDTGDGTDDGTGSGGDTGTDDGTGTDDDTGSGDDTGTDDGTGSGDGTGTDDGTGSGDGTGTDDGTGSGDDTGSGSDSSGDGSDDGADADGSAG